MSHIFFFNDTATTEIYTLSLHDALPISGRPPDGPRRRVPRRYVPAGQGFHERGHSNGSTQARASMVCRSEEHTSELQSRLHLVCRLLLEKKKRSRRSGSQDLASV